jgi:ankyrin repeat protein
VGGNWGIYTQKQATRHGHESLVRLLLENGSNINARSDSRSTALHGALNDQTDVVELLIENGADIDAEDKEGCTALYWAMLLRDRLTVKLLLDKGANIKVRNKEGRSALQASVGHQVLISQMDLGTYLDFSARYLPD